MYYLIDLQIVTTPPKKYGRLGFLYNVLATFCGEFRNELQTDDFTQTFLYLTQTTQTTQNGLHR